MQHDVVIDGKGYFFGKKTKKIGGVEYEIPDNEYPLELIVENSGRMIMLEKHCGIPSINQKVVPKTNELVVQIPTEFYGGRTPEVARLQSCQREIRTIVFISEKPESDQPEIPFSDVENYRVWKWEDECLEMLFRNNAEISRMMGTYKFQQDSDGESYALEDAPYARICYVSDKLNEYSQHEIGAAEQEHYEALRKTNPPKKRQSEPEKPKQDLKNFAKSLEI